MAKTISKGTMTVAILAVFSGLVAAWGVRAYLTQGPAQTQPPPPAPPPPMSVPVASTDLPAGRTIAPGDIGAQKLTRQQYEADPRFKGKWGIMLSAQEIVNRRLKAPVKQGQPFLTTDFYLQGTGPSVADNLRPGYRAIPIQVLPTHEGGIHAGVRVDVVFRSQVRPAREGQPAIPEKTVTLLRHLEILEAVQRSGGRRGSPTSPIHVTLAVPIEQADVLGAVEGRGEMWLAATPTKESEQGAILGTIANPKAVTLADILGIQPPVPPFETAIYRRGHRQVNKFAGGVLVSQTGPPASDAVPAQPAPPGKEVAPAEPAPAQPEPAPPTGKGSADVPAAPGRFGAPDTGQPSATL
ncbi:MAG: Flp pilus assembly protein CpaB [Thermoguttaceae bacterium]|jgi:Flp pilus assembly protein CpaB